MSIGEHEAAAFGLTARELEVIAFVSIGFTNEQIGKHLFLSTETIKSHIRHSLEKLGAKSRAHAVGIAYRQGMLEVTP